MDKVYVLEVQLNLKAKRKIIGLLLVNNGDPITILRNGQPTKTSPEGWIPITENINNDLSSIYLTSTQKIPFIGDKTIITLKQITSILKSITNVLQLDQMYPAGIPIPNGPLNVVSLTATQALATIEASLDSLASKKVKVE
jgi:hypothetical protein